MDLAGNTLGGLAGDPYVAILEVARWDSVYETDFESSVGPEWSSGLP